MKLRLAILAFVLCGCTAYCAEPTQSVDSLIERIAELRRQRAELEKREVELLVALKAELKRLSDAAEKLGLNLPVPPVVPPVVPPKPPEPPAVDPLKEKVLAAIKASTGTGQVKRKQCLDLAALYSAAAKLVPDAAQFPDADALLARLRQAAAQMLGDPDALREVRRVVAGELASALPTVADAPLTAEHRAAAVKVFERVAAILEEAGK